MLTINEIRWLLRDRRLDVVCKATKLHRNTLSGIRKGQIQNPSHDTIRKLSEYFAQESGWHDGGADNAS